MVTIKEAVKRMPSLAAYYFTRRKVNWYPSLGVHIASFEVLGKCFPEKSKTIKISPIDQEILQSWARNYTLADRQLRVCQETTMARTGSLPSPITADSNNIAEETEPWGNRNGGVERL